MVYELEMQRVQATQKIWFVKNLGEISKHLSKEVLRFFNNTNVIYISLLLCI